MDVPLVVFWSLGAVGLAAALLMVTRRNLVHAALYLVVTFFVVAAMFVVLHAEFLAAVQVLVYAGGIMVLYLFVILLVDVHGEEAERGRRRRIHTSAAAALTLLTVGLLAVNILAGSGPTPDRPAIAREGNLEAVADALFRAYLLPFEAVSLLLLVAMVGAIVLARPEPPENPTP